MAKQTAVEWLLESLELIGVLNLVPKSDIERAKEMEKQQIIDCFAESSMAGCVAIGLEVGPKDLKDFEEIGAVYYEEEFKS